MPVVGFRVTNSEETMLKNAAAEGGKSLANLLRDRVFGNRNEEFLGILDRQNQQIEQRINLRFLSIEKKLNDLLFNSRIGAQIAQAIMQNVNPENAEKIVDKIFSEVEKMEKMESEGEK